MLRVAIFLLSVLALFPCTAFAQDGQARQGTTFFDQFVTAGGPIVWFVLIPLSVLTVYLAVYLFLTLTRPRLLPGSIRDQILETVKKTPKNADIVSALSMNTDIVSKAVAYTMGQSDYRSVNLRHNISLARQSLSHQASRLSTPIRWCGIIGSVSPMVGLFGTVFGMIKAFDILGISASQPRPDQLATAISVALITTFWGLLIAIPALTVNGIFSSRLENIFSQASIETEGLIIDMTRKAEAPKPSPRSGIQKNINRHQAAAK